MDWFMVLKLGLGLSVFLYGMQGMSGSLEAVAGGKLEQVLRRCTVHPALGLLTGMAVTMAVQSSSAVTVLLVGLVGGGLMTLRQSLYVIFGANIGTTLTAWLLSLTGLESKNFWVQFLKPEHFSAVLAPIGLLLIMTAKTRRRRGIGTALMGFALLMLGMDLMKTAVAPLADSPAFGRWMIAFQNPLLGVLAGAGLTAVIQSSSASVGMLQALAANGAVSRAMAVPLVLGQNIGTCVTALLSAVGADRNAKRVALLHLLINFFGAAACLVLFWILPKETEPIAPVGVAVIHTLFNVTATVLLLPFSKKLLRLAERS